eukprot:694322-Pleurochrysis_carterae.AAC.2
MVGASLLPEGAAAASNQPEFSLPSAQAAWLVSSLSRQHGFPASAQAVRPAGRPRLSAWPSSSVSTRLAPLASRPPALWAAPPQLEPPASQLLFACSR